MRKKRILLPENHRHVNVGDMIKWNGEFVNGYQSGINKVVEVFEEDDTIWFKMDNNKQYIICFLREVGLPSLAPDMLLNSSNRWEVIPNNK
tara:strand:+ start:335 stop:607 length:273 start_codon:yes stop_codon:yes gene_type:complete